MGRIWQFIKGDNYISVVRELSKKKDRQRLFVKIAKQKKAVQIVFVSTYGVELNQYSGIVQKQVTLEDLFREIIE